MYIFVKGIDVLFMDICLIVNYKSVVKYRIILQLSLSC